MARGLSLVDPRSQRHRTDMHAKVNGDLEGGVSGIE